MIVCEISPVGDQQCNEHPMSFVQVLSSKVIATHKVFLYMVCIRGRLIQPVAGDRMRNDRPMILVHGAQLYNQLCNKHIYNQNRIVDFSYIAIYQLICFVSLPGENTVFIFAKY